MIADLTIEQAFNILDDEKVAFDANQDNKIGQLKHHSIAQTHPYHCLNQAVDIVRYENLSADIELLRGKFGFSTAISEPKAIQCVALTESERNRTRHYYAQDYQLLGYGPAGDVTHTSA